MLLHSTLSSKSAQHSEDAVILSLLSTLRREDTTSLQDIGYEAVVNNVKKLQPHARGLRMYDADVHHVSHCEINNYIKYVLA